MLKPEIICSIEDIPEQWVLYNGTHTITNMYGDSADYNNIQDAAEAWYNVGYERGFF